MKHNIDFKTKGMNRDVSPSSFSNELTFENVNLRLTTNEGNTMMSWVNEKGTKAVEIIEIVQAWDGEYVSSTIEGTVIGTAVINHQLVLFTTIHEFSATFSTDRIYVFTYDNEEKTVMAGKLLFKGNLNFDVNYPLETMVAYEASYIQKVYWTDNRNQPRLINIAASKDKIAKWQSTLSSKRTYFDFIPSFEMEEEDVKITKNCASGGIFAPGVIQYLFTYVNKYGQESNVAYQSTLYYLNHVDRGASPEDKVSSSFTITINNADTNFDYVRLYSIQRTSLDSEPFAKKLEDLTITAGATLTYIDNGTTGSTVDPTELLYLGGKEIKALTMVDKDNTLFLGNITQVNSLVNSIQEYYDDLRKEDETTGIIFKTSPDKTVTNDHAVGIYSYTNELSNSHRDISTFKGGEVYRFGFQLQKKTGEWVTPIFMNDIENTVYPDTSITSDSILLPYAEANIPITKIANYYNKNRAVDEDGFYSIFKSIRPVIVYPSLEDRNVLCQGVVNPTVFNADDRIDNSPFAQASWFFRPYIFSKPGEISSSSGSYTTNLNITVDFTTEYTTEAKADEAISDSINAYLSDHKLLKDVYILTANVRRKKYDEKDEKAPIDIINNRGYLICHSDTQVTIYNDDGISIGSKIVTETIKESFDGVIVLDPTTQEDYARCAYIKDTPFTEEVTSDTKNVTYQELEDVKVDNSITFKFYKDMEVTTSNNIFYYPKQTENTPNPYIFMFRSKKGSDSSIYVYTVTFPALSEDTPYVPSSDLGGSPLRFKHYDSLYTVDDIINKDDCPTLGKYLEIEGAKKEFSSVYATTKPTDLGSTNTQFFVDQSILTLNSPDIEFDTDIQTYSWEGLRMRVVGAIPITAYQSSHVITTSTDMIETYHNNTAKKTDVAINFGVGELSTNVIHNNVSQSGGQRLIADYLWNDTVVTTDTSKDDGITTGEGFTDFLVYPWQKSGSLNNDTRAISTTKDGNTYSAASYLETKKEGHLSYSLNSVYLDRDNFKEYEYLNTQIHLTENDEIMNMRLNPQTSYTDQINYYPNIDKVLMNTKGSKAIHNTAITEKYTITSANWGTSIRPISMKYKSTSHAVVVLKAPTDTATSIHTTGKTHKDELIPIMPNAKVGDNIVGYYSSSSSLTFWGKDMYFAPQSQGEVDLTTAFKKKEYDFLWLAEIYKDVDDSGRFGGKSKTALMGNKWIVGGEAQKIYPFAESVTLKWTEGDTFYQRYDCLKTYPYTNEDPNQMTEILSFMCETHVNIDGRYDKNRGQVKNYLMRPENFNQLNPIYSQQNNFFTSRIMDIDNVAGLSYPNHLYYSKTKENGADVDLWTNVTMATTLELDGDKGEITSLNRFNDQIIAFQDTGIAQVLYNENAQISTTDGVPIELANSGKVQGKRYLSNTIGCSNKWSIVQTPTAIYFMDNNDKSIYMFNGSLGNLSTTKGFNAWSKQNIPSDIDWNPVDYGNFRAVYDKLNQEVLFINGSTALAYSEVFGMFTSFYDYGGAPYFVNFDDTGIWVKDNTLWKHQAGDYCSFFGNNKPYSMTLLAADQTLPDMIFTNLEFMANVEEEGTYNKEKEVFTPTLPFDSIEAWDEYQHGTLSLTNGNNKATARHGNDSGVLARKFRKWRCDIPRDNAPIDDESESKLGIKRFKVRPLDRMRNPWLYMKLKKDAASNDTLKKVEIHDVRVTVFS